MCWAFSEIIIYMRKSSVGLMVLPVVCLAAFAALTRGRTPRPPGLYIEKVELVELTPREVSQGYDGMARIELNCAGPGPKWWGATLNGMALIDPLAGKPLGADDQKIVGLAAVLLAGKDKSRVVVGSRESKAVRMAIPRWEKTSFWGSGHYVADCRFKLDDVPKGAGTVRLAVAAGLPLGTIVRRTIQVPPEGDREGKRLASRVTDVKVLKTNVRTLTPIEGGETGDCEVTAEVQYTGAEKLISWKQRDEFVVVDSNGKQWTHTELNDGLGASFRSNDSDSGQTVKKQEVGWTFSTRRLPPGRAVFKGGMGIGDGWVEPITVVLWTGKEKPPQLPLSTLKILEVKVRAANTEEKRDGMDTATVVRFKTTTPLPAKPKWIVNYSQHIVDGKGREHWTIWKANGEGVSMPVTGPTWDAVGKCWKVTYSYRVAQFRTGRVLFRAEIGLPGEKLVEVGARV